MLKRFFPLFLVVFGFLMVPMVALADVSIPTKTTVYFEVDGEAYDGEVEYTVDCYGYTHKPWLDPENEPSRGGLPEGASFDSYHVYSYSATCPEYGCEIYENYYMNYREITHCTVTGTTAHGDFVIEDFGVSPYTTCEYPDQNWDMYDGKYWRYTDEYWTCLEGNSYDYVACQGDLILVPEDELEMDPWGQAFDRMCESYFEIDLDGYVGGVSGGQGLLYETQFLISLLMTIVLELLVVLALVYGVFRIKTMKFRKILGVVIIASGLTLPYLWFVMGPYVDSRYFFYFGEIGVIVVESLVYFSLLQLKLPKAFLIALVANLVSFGVGLLLLT